MVPAALASTRHPTPARRVGRLVLCVGLFVAAGYLGRITIIDHTSVSLVWPAAGVAALWLSSGNRRTWPIDGAALVVATFLVNATTGAPLDTSVAFTVSNLLQVATFVALSRWWTDDVWGLGGTQALHRLADLGGLVAAATAASFVGAVTGAMALTVTAAGADPASFAVWWGRNSVSMIVIVSLGLLAGPVLLAARSAGDLGRILYDAIRARTFGRLVEAELLVVCSVVLYVLLFGQRTAQPLSFLVLVLTVWAGLRFSAVAVLLHGLAMGGAGILFTLHGNGPFAAIESEHFRALVAQLFVATTVLTGLSLAFSRAERDKANQRLTLARRDADQRARLLGAVLESMNEGLVVVEDGGRILVSNAASKSLLGVETLEGRVLPAAEYGLFHADGIPLADRDFPMPRALAGEEVPPTDYHLRVDSVPEGRVLEIGAHPLEAQDESDPPVAVVNIRDVTLDRQHRDALASFAGVVAHDLFNPLTIVSGWTETLEEEFADGSVPASVGMPMVARIHDAASHMRHVIGDLLAYTVARDQSLRPTSVDLTAEIRSLALLRIDAPGAPLITVAPGLQVWADPGLVRQLFDNLLGNAVKYVGPGVRPRVEVRGHQDGDELEIRVSDNGIGIPEEERERVFESFHRAHDSNYQGTGLGLAICRRIADRHGGSIRAEAGPGGTGTTFVVRLPASSTGYTPPQPRLRQAHAPEPRRQSV